jgi:hypothetical protein
VVAASVPVGVIAATAATFVVEGAVAEGACGHREARNLENLLDGKKARLELIRLEIRNN